MSEGEAYPLALWVEVAGRKMERDFEPVLERRLHPLDSPPLSFIFLGLPLPDLPFADSRVETGAES